MSALAIGAIVFACVFAGAVFGMFLGRVLPKEHLSADAKDVIKVTMAMIATLAALVLGLLTASAKSSLDDKENEVRGWAAKSSCSTARSPNTGRRRKDARELIKQTLAARIAQMWPGHGEAVDASTRSATAAGIEGVQRAARAYSARRMPSAGFKSTALHDHQHHGRAPLADLRSRIASTSPWPFLVVLMFWLAVIFASFGLFAPRNTIVVAALFVAALSVAGLDLSHPRDGPAL